METIPNRRTHRCRHSRRQYLVAELGQVSKELEETAKETIMVEMKRYLECIRQWSNPWSETCICSITGTAIKSVRIPLHCAGPCEDEEEFTKCLLSTASKGGFKSQDAFLEALSRAKAIQKSPHKIVFPHGDFKHHNIMVDGGHVTGFLDW